MSSFNHSSYNVQTEPRGNDEAMKVQFVVIPIVLGIFHFHSRRIGGTPPFIFYINLK